MIIGLATYGRSFTLSGSVTGMGAAASGAGVRGQYTREAGFLSYYEVTDQQMLNKESYYLHHVIFGILVVDYRIFPNKKVIKTQIICKS